MYGFTRLQVFIIVVHSRSTLSAPSGVVSSNRRTTSVRVSWQAVEDADRYTVTLSKTIGEYLQRGPCHEGPHIVSVATSGLSVVVGQTTEDMLRPFTTYNITVVAENNVLGSSEPSDPVRVTTNPTSECEIFSWFHFYHVPLYYRCISVSSQCESISCKFYSHLCPLGWPERLQRCQWAY